MIDGLAVDTDSTLQISISQALTMQTRIVELIELGHMEQACQAQQYSLEFMLAHPEIPEYLRSQARLVRNTLCERARGQWF